MYPEEKHGTNLCPISYRLYLKREACVFCIFPAHTGKSNLQSYISIGFVKLVKNIFIEFLS